MIISKIKTFLRILTSTLLIISCISSEKKKNNVENTISTNINPCEIQIRLDEEKLDTVLNHAELVLRDVNTEQIEGCLLDLVSSISELVISQKSEKALVALDSIAYYSDGFLTEFISSNLVDILNERTILVGEYLYRNQNSNFVVILLDGLALEWSSLNAQAQKLRYEKLIQRIAHQFEDDPRKKSYLIKLISSADL